MFVVEGNKAIKKDFTLGIIGDDYCEVLSGLSEGDAVIVEGLNAFRQSDEIELEKQTRKNENVFFSIIYGFGRFSKPGFLTK